MSGQYFNTRFRRKKYMLHVQDTKANYLKEENESIYLLAFNYYRRRIAHAACSPRPHVITMDLSRKHANTNVHAKYALRKSAIQCIIVMALSISQLLVQHSTSCKAFLTVTFYLMCNFKRTVRRKEYTVTSNNCY